MKENRLKMNAQTFRRITIPILAVVIVLCMALNTAAALMKTTIDTYLGKGETIMVEATGAENWDTDYYSVPTSTEEAKAKGYEVAERVMQEGMILLKNNGVLPLAQGSTLTPFGRGYLDPIYGQLTSSGSAKWVTDPITPEAALSTIYTINNAAVNKMKGAEVTPLGEAPGTTTAGDTNAFMGGNSFIYEYDPAIYNGLTGADGTGIVFITRAGQEGSDKKYDAYSDGTPHYLALSQNERGAIMAAKKSCGKVIVVLVTSAAMELGDLMTGELEVDAIVWVGHPDEIGFQQLPGLLCGDINPSGRTVDIYPADFTADPSYQNFGEFHYTNYIVTSGSYTDGGTFPGFFVEYQESVYMGYRYYETAHDIDSGFVYGTLDGKGAYVTPGAVCYPFGYGLSYTTFTQHIVSFDDSGDEIVVKVEVTNTGDRSGKEVVQLYLTAPYTQFDVDNRIEKPTAVLAAFDKTALLDPNTSETLTLSFPKEEMASYCYTHQNPNGTVGCYVLEEGEYVISLRSNSHDILETRSANISSTVWYDGSDADHIRQSEKDAQSYLDDNGIPTGVAMNGEFVAAVNLFQTSSDYMTTNSTLLTRANWKSTFPKTPAGREKELNEEFIPLMGYDLDFDVQTDPRYGNVEGSLVYYADQPTSNAQNGLTLADMRGLEWDDPRWEDYLDQIDWDADKDGFVQNHSGASYSLGAISSLGIPGTVHADGANGLKVQGLNTTGYDMTKTAGYPFAPVQCATWNTELMYELANAMGQEAIAHGVSGWYSPAINLHRSPFCGRIFEYYSEDPLLTGKMAAASISGAGDAGMACYLKHFALNDQETGRASILATWADEQTMRELYLRAFEIAFKEARMTLKYIDTENGGVSTTKVMRAATAAMAAQSCIGPLMGHTNPALLQNLLRDEWGFRGMVITDYWVWNGDSLRDLCIRSGSDAYLCMAVPAMWNISDYDSPTARWAMRNAMHNTAYTLANSNVNQGAAPGATYKTTMSPWQIALIAVDVAVVGLTALWVVALMRKAKNEKAHPELYKPRKQNAKET